VSLGFLLLGLAQGLTEFLPVSSSGHLALVKRLVGLPYLPLAFDVTVHLATLFAVVFYFRRRLWGLVLGALGGEGEALRTVLFVAVASLPTGVLGLSLKDAVEAWGADLRAVGCGFLLTASLLLLSKRGRSAGDLGMGGFVLRALAVGVVQGFALFPGVSRSGSTISAMLAMGLDRERAFELSFLMFLPASLGAFLLEVKEGMPAEAIGGSSLWLASAALAFSSGLLALSLVGSVVRRGSLWRFAPYCALVGALSFWVEIFGLGR